MMKAAKKTKVLWFGDALRTRYVALQARDEMLHDRLADTLDEVDELLAEMKRIESQMSMCKATRREISKRRQQTMTRNKRRKRKANA